MHCGQGGHMSFTELRKFVAPETIFGVGAVDLAGQYASKFGISNRR